MIGAGQMDLRGGAEDGRCASGAGCTSGVCSPDGVCASEDAVAYVDNRGGFCTGTRRGTRDDPHCDLPAAIEAALASGRPHVSVAGSAAPYERIRIAGARIGIHAAVEGRAAVTIRGVIGPAVEVEGNAWVYLEGLSLTSGLGDVVRCLAEDSKAAELILSRVRIHEGLENGVHASFCRLRVQRSVIERHARAGILAEEGSVVHVENSIIARNHRGGVIAPAAERVLLRFSTLAYNGVGGAAGGGVPGGVDCGRAAFGGRRLIEGSLLVFNTHGAGGSQLSETCTMVSSAIDEPRWRNGSNNRLAATPAFGSDLHLARGPGAEECCIDQLASGATSSDPEEDFDGEARPMNGLFDIGADEVNHPR